MTDREAESLVEQVLAGFNERAPVDLCRIAREEGIELIEGNFGEDFHGRLEFLPELGTFALFYPMLANARYRGRIRFSIAHELAHYFIESHRYGIMNGLFHNSEEGFRSLNAVEAEADKFASALLIPAKAINAAMKSRRFLTLDQVLNLAAECDASAQATAFRYVRFAEEPCVAVVSNNCRILYTFASDEADGLGFGHVGNKQVPAGSATARATMLEESDIQESASNTTLWFSSRFRRAELWEEAVRLGSTSLVLTLLAWQDNESD